MQCLLTSEIKLLQFINFSRDSDIETIILQWSRANKKSVIAIINSKNLQFHTAGLWQTPTCSHAQYYKQKAADALSGPNISPLNGQKILPNIFYTLSAYWIWD